MLISLLLPLRAPAPASRFSPPGDAVAFHFFDRIAVAIVIESICDRVDSNSWTVPTSRQFVDTEHPGADPNFRIADDPPRIVASVVSDQTAKISVIRLYQEGDNTRGHERRCPDQLEVEPRLT